MKTEEKIINTKVEREELLNGLPLGVLAIDGMGLILEANHQAISLLCLNKNSIVGHSLAEMLPNGFEEIEQVIHSKRQAAGMVVPELSNCFLHISPFTGRHMGAVISILDYRLWHLYFGLSTTTDPLNPYLKKVVEASPDGITLTNSQGIMIFVNKAGADNVGVKQGELIGRHVSYLIKKNYTKTILSLDVIRTKKTVSRVVEHRKTGKLVLSTATPILNADGEVDMVVLNERDITAITKVESSLRYQQKMVEKIKEEIMEMSLADVNKSEMLAESPAMCAVISTALKLAHHSVSHVLITGESGTGKSLLAKFIHRNSQRSDSPFVHINCAALPEALLEAELFGYEKGSFTGADPNGKAGLLEMAADGTMFLDEIAEMPISLQAKLLTFLDSNEFRRVGGKQTIHSQCAIITATNQNLELLAKNRQFRPDLAFRLRAFSLAIPPLRQRVEDIILLAKAALDKFNAKYSTNRHLDPLAIDILSKYSYPGNVRELFNMIHQAVLLSEKKFIGSYLKATCGLAAAEINIPLPEENLQPQRIAPKGNDLDSAVAELEKEALKQALEKSCNTRDMAALLGISQATVSRKLTKYGLVAPGKKKRS